MAELNYNIKDLFFDAFGINAPIYRVNNDQSNSEAIAYPSINDESKSKADLSFSGIEYLPESYTSDSKSWMGTPIIFPATFKGGAYNKYMLNGEMERVRLNNMQLPAATMFSFRRSKNIERTNLLGSNGTVKEIYGFDDWIIDVKGICLDEPNQTAHEQYEALLEWESLADAIEITGHLFEQKEISAVSMSDWNDNVVQGKPGVIPFSFQLFSDEPIELVIQNRFMS